MYHAYRVDHSQHNVHDKFSAKSIITLVLRQSIVIVRMLALSATLKTFVNSSSLILLKGKIDTGIICSRLWKYVSVL